MGFCRYACAAFAILIGSSVLVAPAADSDPVREGIRRKLEGADGGLSLDLGGERVHAVSSVRRFYDRRAFAPAWTRESAWTADAAELLESLSRATDEGLDPLDYHASALEARAGSLRGATARRNRELRARLRVELELLLTDAFLLYGAHCLAGRLNPETIDPEWHARRREADLVPVLERALQASAVRDELARLLPAEEGYARLRAALADQRRVVASGGWPALPEGSTLRSGEFADRVRLLRERLRVSADLGPEIVEVAELFDAPLEAAVRRFQRRHGLEVDGVVGRATLAALNVPAEERLRQIAVNLERWRWLPQDLGARHVSVHIADFRLEAVERGRATLEMRAIVGRDYRRTPVFSDRIGHLVLNPSWDVPATIAGNDILPLVQRDPDYLSRMGFVVFDPGARGRRIDPAEVDWQALRPETMPYRLRQLPGPQNALGRIKFMFPNKFNVYLHDTPARELFARAERAFSSGCIRIEKPIELALWLLEPDSGWSRTAILAAIRTGKEQTVRLAQPVPVHLLYWTAWVEASGEVNFRRDLYGRDRAVAQALVSPPPSERTR